MQRKSSGLLGILASSVLIGCAQVPQRQQSSEPLIQDRAEGNAVMVPLQEEISEQDRETETAQISTETYVPRNGDACKADGTMFNSLDGQSENNSSDTLIEDQLDAIRRERAQELFANREPFELYRELRNTVDALGREGLSVFFRTGEGPEILKAYSRGFLPGQRYISQMMGAIDWGIRVEDLAENIADERRFDESRERLHEPTTGGTPARVTPEEERALDEEFISNLQPMQPVILLQPLKDPVTLYTRSRMQSPDRGYNERMAQERREREIETYGSIDRLVRLTRLSQQRSAECTVYEHEFLNPGDVFRNISREERARIMDENFTRRTRTAMNNVINAINAATNADYDAFHSLIIQAAGNLPTLVVETDDEFYHPLNERSTREFYETLRTSSGSEISMHARDTGLGSEILLRTRRAEDTQELLLTVREEGIAGVTIIDSFENNGRWDLERHVSFENATQTLSAVRQLAESKSFLRFREQFTLQDRRVVEIYSALINGRLTEEPFLWQADTGDGIKIGVNVVGRNRDFENYSRNYILTIQNTKITNCEIFSSEGNSLRR